MTRTQIPHSPRRLAAGLTLVEIMVALVLGAILLLGVMQIYLGTKTGYRTQEALSRLQENGRFAVEFLSRDLRMAGESGGCRNLGEVEPNIIANGVSFDFGSSGYVYGHEAGSGWTNPTSHTRVGNSDVLIVRRSSVVQTQLTGNMGAVNANIQITANPQGFEAGDVLIISDCEAADIFKATNVSSGGTVTIAHSQSNNSANFLSKAYDTEANLMRFEEKTYFIGENADGHPALFRLELDGTVTELVEGVEDMQVSYGLDNSGDRRVDVYESADTMSAADWSQVMAIRVDLLMRTREEVSPEETAYRYNSTTVNNPGDLRLRRWFSTTVTLRNIAL